VLFGPSGSGKTTLLNLIGCLDRRDAGEVFVAGRDVSKLSDDELADFRGEHIGFVFQSFSLIPVLTAFENVEYPLVLAGVDKERRRRSVQRMLERVGLADQAGKMPGRLSGGQRQRVAIARALIRKPQLLIADEPTANLDSKSGAALIELLKFMQAKYRMSFIFSTHDPRLSNIADDVVVVKDGRVQVKKRRVVPVTPDFVATGADEPA
jgi:putative ABC transport system ATP-binding protein